MAAPSQLLVPQNKLIVPSRPKLWRNETPVTIGTTDTKLVGPNPRRWAISFSTPVGGASGGGQSFTSQTQSAHNASGAVIATILSYTVPVGKNSIFTFGSWNLTAGAANFLGFQYTPSGGSAQIVVTNNTGTLDQTFNLPLAAGDNIAMIVRTASAGFTFDTQMGIQEYSAGGAGGTDNTVWISLEGPAVSGNGMPLHPGATPFLILYDHAGQAIREEIRAIAANAPVVVTAWDIFEVGCPCVDY